MEKFYETPKMGIVKLNVRSSLLVISDGGPGKDDEEVEE